MIEEHVFHQWRERLYDNLVENVLPFWAENTWDAEYGGFLTRLDRRGRRIESDEKFLMMQVRMIAALSWAHHDGMRSAGYLDKARRGYEFLIDHFLDHDAGGFFFSVARDGRPRNLRKNTDVHAYALIGLSAYHTASGQRDPLEYARQIFDLLETRARDGRDGYAEDFDGGWWPVLNAQQMNLPSGARIKTIDMHTNVLEAFSYLAEVTGERRHREALHTVLDLILARGLHREHGCSITAFDGQWNPVADAGGSLTTSYGINVELAWLLKRACEVLGRPLARYEETILRLIDHALENGFDHTVGGLASYGPLSGSVAHEPAYPPEASVRAWWIQAELLNALFDAIALTGADRYRRAFIKQCEWIWKRQIDHECGDWYLEIDPTTGAPLTTEKGGEWKTAFHVSRALMRVGVRKTLW